MMQQTINSLISSFIFSTISYLIIDNLLFVITCFYDGHRPKKLVFFTDLIYCLYFSLVTISILYFFNSGKFRWYYLAVELMSIILYNALLSKPVHMLVSALIFPIKVLIKTIVKILRKIVRIFTNSIAKIKQRMYNNFMKC